MMETAIQDVNCGVLSCVVGTSVYV